MIDAPPKSLRFYFCRLRMLTHPLRIQTRNNTPIHDRHCLICKKDIEDEYHFVMECKLYSEIRKLYIDKYYWKNPNMFKFVELVKSENVRINNNLALYVNKAFKLRNLFNLYYDYS